MRRTILNLVKLALHLALLGEALVVLVRSGADVLGRPGLLLLEMGSVLDGVLELLVLSLGLCKS